LNVRTALLLAVVVLAGTGGDIALTMAMKKVARGEPWTWRIAPRRIGRALIQSQMWVGIGLMILSFLAFITVLSWADVSFAVPATASNYIVGPIGAKLLLKERLTKGRWAGMVLVAAGVALVCAAG
jgi:drug/metabolite transporter (DMT)-like permease